MRLALLLQTALALAPAQLDRRTLLRQAGAAGAALSAWPSVGSARDLYLSQEAYCAQSATPRGAAFGCEPFVDDVAKRNLLAGRARARLEEARGALARFERTTSFDSAGASLLLREELRGGALGSFRKEGKRIIALADPPGEKVPPSAMRRRLEPIFEKVSFEMGELDVAARRAADAGGGGEPAALVRRRLTATRSALDDFLSAGESVGSAGESGSDVVVSPEPAM
jgi:hypothetical protein